MICLIAMVVFGILGIFSATNRKIAKEAFECVFKRVTFRKCTTGLDQRLKSEITGKLMRRKPKFGAFVFKYFEVISWFFTILMLASIGWTGYSIYNYAVYGNCNGPIPNAFCVFDVFSQGQVQCSDANVTGTQQQIVYPTADDDPFLGQADARVTVIEFGCYACDYTRKAAPVMKKIVDNYGDKIKFVFRDFPLDLQHATAVNAAEASQCAFEQDKFWQYSDKLFASQTKNFTRELLQGYAADLGLNTAKFNDCLVTEKYRAEVEKDYNDGLKAGVHGTPTFFINNQTLVGYQDYQQMKKVIEEELAK